MGYRKIAAFAIASALVAGCATMPSDTEQRAKALQIMKASFKSRGAVTLDRLDQDETQALCSGYANQVPRDVAKRIENANLHSIKYPADGRYLGDWKEGEKIAQSGRGLQFNDPVGSVNGANCYACHQLAPQELSYGSIGPSLYRYIKQRGNSEEAVKYTWGKVYNAEAYMACSAMPRFGHNKILTEDQIRHVVALLLDPESPVNK